MINYNTLNNPVQYDVLNYTTLEYIILYVTILHYTTSSCTNYTRLH